MIDNLYKHADGDFYCLLSENAPLKHPDSGDWMAGVIYIGTDQQMRSTTWDRWLERFAKVDSYTGTDEDVLNMIRRANPGSQDFDFIRTFESWHESEANITSMMLELAVAATIVKYRPDSKMESITLKTEDLQHINLNYEIAKEAIPHGFIFTIHDLTRK